MLRAEKLLKPKRKGKAEEALPADDEEPAPDSDALEAYATRPGAIDGARPRRV